MGAQADRVVHVLASRIEQVSLHKAHDDAVLAIPMRPEVELDEVFLVAIVRLHVQALRKAQRSLSYRRQVTRTAGHVA